VVVPSRRGGAKQAAEVRASWRRTVGVIGRTGFYAPWSGRGAEPPAP